MLEVKHLTKQYGDRRGVDDISFTIEKGEIVGLLGPNGAGKSTIMKMMTGYIPPTSGTVIVDGFDVVEHPREVSKRMGFLPEIPPLYPEMTVEEFLLFLAKIRGVPKAQRKSHVAEIMGLASVDQVKERLIRNLSKGYRQRVGLAQALISLPEILILDEPTVGLDPKQITEVRELIHKLSQDHTIILSSHILSEISAICEKVIIINKGKLVTVDSMEHLASHAAESGSFQLRLIAPEAAARALLAALPQAQCVAPAAEAPQSGTCCFTLTGGEGTALREAVFALCAKEHFPILELRTVGETLEDVFLTLTSEAPSVPAGEGEAAQ